MRLDDAAYASMYRETELAKERNKFSEAASKWKTIAERKDQLEIASQALEKERI